MKRRAFERPDSLELLLDTMCNAFGGIILIALLIALVARDRPANRTAESPRVTELKRQIAAEEARVAQTSASAAELEDRLSRPESQDRSRRIAERDSLREQLTQLQNDRRAARDSLSTAGRPGHSSANKLPVLRRELEEISRRRNEATTRNATLERKQESIQGELNVLERRVAALERRDIRKLRLPHEHSTGKKPWDIIVRYGRVYPLHWWRNGQREPNQITLAWRRSPDRTVLVEPDPNLGVNPTRDAAGVLGLLRGIPSRDFYLIFHVYEDSFGAFNTVKETAIRFGFEYTWLPLENQTELRAGGAAGPAPPPL